MSHTTRYDMSLADEVKQIESAYFGEDISSNRQRMRKSYLFWIPEVLYCFGAIMFVVAIAGTAAWADRKHPPVLPLGLTLNAIFALCTTLSRLLFMGATVGALSQLKWIWFTGKARRLRDFQLFNNACDGPYGSLLLLSRGKGTLACIAATIGVTALLTSPFTQQIISYPTFPGIAENETASVVRARTISRFDGESFVQRPGDRLAIKHNLQMGLYNVNGTETYLQPTCSTAECHWPIYGSLGVCSLVANITELSNQTLLSQISEQTRLELEYLNNSSPRTPSPAMLLGQPIPSPQNGVVVGYLPYPTAIFDSAVIDTALIDIFVAFPSSPIDTSITNHYSELKFQFLEIIFYGCTKSFATEVKNGISVTKEVSSSNDIMPSSVAHSVNFFWSPDYVKCFVEGQVGCNASLQGSNITLAPPPPLAPSPSEKYTVDIFTVLSLSYALYTDFIGGFLQNNRSTTAAQHGDLAFAAFAALFGDRTGLESFSPETQYRNIKQLANNIAITLTNGLREFGPTVGNGGDDAVVGGTAHTPQVFVVISWGWLSLLVMQTTLSSMLLLATVIVTRRCGLQILKGSSLATMFALHRHSPRLSGGIYDYRALEKECDNYKVQLVRGTSGTGFWLAPPTAEPGTRES